jgi:site-specific DNA-methyltransferase (adenine-specific)
MTTHTIHLADSRSMPELADSSVHLVVTSPPYWQLKDYGAANQIGFDDDYRAYINNLNLVWEECARVLNPGCRLVVNIGDQFARAAHYGRYKVIPIREEIVGFCEKQLALDYMGAIIWQKVTTCNTSGGASIMGSFPYPRNGIIKIDYEFILTFKKPGIAPGPPSPEAKEAARMTTEEWNQYFYGHWNFTGERQVEHIAPFPVELPHRLIRMFTFPGETVLDPFLGSGTTALAARRLGRDSVGYEINPDLRPVIEKKVLASDDLIENAAPARIEFCVRDEAAPADFSGRIARWSAGSPALENGASAIVRQADPRCQSFGSRVSFAPRQKKPGFRVKEVLAPNRIRLADGREMALLGLEPWADDEERTVAACRKLRDLIGRGKVHLSDDDGALGDGATGAVYVHLSNAKLVNAHMIRSGYAKADRGRVYRHRKRFIRFEDEARQAGLGLWGEPQVFHP